MNLQEKQQLRSSILKKALGYDVDEICEEYALDDDDLKLIKRKVNKKHIPPDYLAFKVLCEYFEDNNQDLSNLSDKELDAKIDELITLLKGV